MLVNYACLVVEEASLCLILGFGLLAIYHTDKGWKAAVQRAFETNKLFKPSNSINYHAQKQNIGSPDTTFGRD